MARGPKKHLKRLHAPKHWMLNKLGGVWAPRPSSGPHKLRESLPLVVLLRNRLKYALRSQEATFILKNRSVKVDGKVRTDTTFPAGFQDVISIPATGDLYRMLYDPRGIFYLHRIDAEESKFKLCKVTKQGMGSKSIPYVVTHDGRTLRFPNPEIKVNDTIKVNLETSEIVDHAPCGTGNLVMVTGGANVGRIGELTHIERHHGGFDMAYLRDRVGHSFCTRLSNVFTLGKGSHSLISLPKNGGVRLTIHEKTVRAQQKAAKKN